MNQKLFLVISSALLVSSCASSYKPVNPSSMSYSDEQRTDWLSYSYQYNVLQRAGNKKYAKYEIKRDVRVVAVKLTNNTGKTIIPSSDLEIISGNRSIQLLDPAMLRKELKQNVPIYLLYLLLTPMNFNKYEEVNGIKTNSSTVPVGLVVGPGLSILNMAIAGSANKNLEAELQQYSLDKPVENGGTMYALIGFKSADYNPITIRIRNR